MKQIIIVIILLFLIIPSVFSQSNELMDSFLAEEKADVKITAYLVLLSADLIDETAGPEEAADYLMGTPWGIKVLRSDKITYGNFSMMTMEVLMIRGGLFYTLFHSPRYAAREFNFLGFIPGKTYSAELLTPLEVITGLNAALDWKEAEL